MKKYFYKSTVVLLAIAFLITFFASCGEKDVTEDKELIDIIKDGKSEYVLVSNPSDSIAEYASTAVWNLLYDGYGVSLKKVSDDVQSDYEIIIGNAAREGVAEIREKCNSEDDFAICQSGNRLYLYAETFTGAKKLVLALRDHFLPACSDGILSFEKELLVLGHEQSASVFSGEAVELIKNGKSDYTIVCNSQNQKDLSVAHYLSRSIQQVCENKPSVIDYQRSDFEYEIVLGTGTLKHDAYATVRRSLKGTGQYVFAVSGKKLIITATDEKSLLDAVEYFVVNYLSGLKDGNCAVYECEEVRSQLGRNGFSMSEERMRELYADVLNLYPTLYQMYYKNNVTGLSKSDQEMIDVLIERMGESIVLRNGSSSILYDGMIRKLDKSDYGRIAKLSPSVSTVPAAFVNEYFGTSYGEDQEIDLQSAAEQAGYSYDYDATRKIAILTPTGSANFTDDSAKVGKYTNAQLKDRMVAFFENSAMPEPQNNTEQSRVVIEDAVDYFPENSYDYTQPTYTCYYSPGVLTVGNVIYSSVEQCKVKDDDEPSATTVIRKSVDGGLTWEITHKIDRLKWASMFLLEDEIYIVGFLKNDGAWQGGTWIGKVLDDENSDTVEAIKLTKLWDDVSAIFEPLVVDGILYFPLDSTVASVPVNKDITVASNWTRTQDSAELIDRAWFKKTSGKELGNTGTAECLEGNVVKGRDGEIYVIYRIESQPYGNYAVMLKLSDDRTSLELLPNNGSLIRIPTTVARFVIKYDQVSDQYVMISNWYLTENACRARNVLGISVSDDLMTWREVDTLLVEREMINTECSCWKTGFQYVDWDFNGEDLILTVRETVGFANTFHDGKYFTFYRVSDFRSLCGINMRIG